MNWKPSYIYGLCISIFFNYMGLYLGVIVKSHNDECLIYMFTEIVENFTRIIINKTLYHSWYK